MTRQHRQARIELLAAADALARIFELTDEGRERYDLEADRRGHLRYLWIVVGSRLKNHGTVLDIPRAGGPFGPAIALRNKLAYTAPGRIDDLQVWNTGVEDAPCSCPTGKIGSTPRRRDTTGGYASAGAAAPPAASGGSGRCLVPARAWWP